MIRFVDETGSTNADLAEAVRAKRAPLEGDWLIARRQSAGRGRQGRAWFDGSGNFMGSTCVKVEPDNPAPATLSFVAGLAVYETVSEVLSGTAQPQLKWPNDVMLGDGKLSGILLEMVETCVIVGIGVNLAKAPQVAGRVTAAIADQTPAPELEWFAGRLAERFADRLAAWRDAGLAQTLAEFLMCSVHKPGAPVTVHDSDGSALSGAFAGLDESDGALLIRLADGSQRVIRAGDVN